MNPNFTRVFETGDWNFHNIRNQFMISLSVRRDFIKALNDHFMLNGLDWTTVAAQEIGEYGVQHVEFIKNVQDFIISPATPPKVRLISSNGETWCCTADLVEICNDFDMRNYVHNPIINIQPIDKNVLVDSVAEFRVSCIYVDSYEWFESADGANWVTTNTFNEPLKIKAAIADNNTYFRAKCVGKSVVYTNTVKLGVFLPLIITKNPVDKLLQPVNSIVEFDAACDNSTSVQWEQQFAGTTEWVASKADGHDTDTVSVVIETADNNSNFRARFESPVETKITSTANLTIDVSKTLPRLIKHPFDVITEPNTTVLFDSIASTFDTVQWQESADGAAWTDAIEPSSHTPSLLVQATEAKHGSMYRAAYTNVIGTINSNVAHLAIVKHEPTIVTQPVNKSVALDAPTSFDSTCTGFVTVKWEELATSTTDWVASTRTGFDTESLKIASATTDLNGYGFRAVYTNPKGVTTTDEVSLSLVYPDPTITLQPVNSTVNENGTTTFSVDGVFDTVRWFASTAVDVWVSGADTKTITLADVRYTSNGTKFKAVLTRYGKTVDSNVVVLTVVQAKPVVTVQPLTITDCVAGVASSLTCNATGYDTIQWMQNDGVGEFTNSSYAGSTSTTMILSDLVKADESKHFKCSFTNSGGVTYSNICGITVLADPPLVTVQPISVYDVAIGETVKFNADATNSDSVKWFVVSVTTGLSECTDPGFNTNELSVLVSEAFEDRKYYAEYKNRVGVTDTSMASLVIDVDKPFITLHPVKEITILSSSFEMLISDAVNYTSSIWQIRRSGSTTWTDYSSLKPIMEPLVLRNLSVADSGCAFRAKYVNVASVAYSTETVVTVLADGVPTIVTQPTSLSIVEPAEIKFTVVCEDEKTVEWFKNGESVGTGLVYTQPVSNRSDTGGVYFARVSNDFGAVDTETVTLTVEYPANVLTLDGDGLTLNAERLTD